MRREPRLKKKLNHMEVLIGVGCVDVYPTSGAHEKDDDWEGAGEYDEYMFNLGISHAKTLARLRPSPTLFAHTTTTPPPQY